MDQTVAASPPKSWVRTREVLESLARIALGVTQTGDVDRLTEAAPPGLRAAVPLMARCLRAQQVLLDEWERRREVARTLVERVASTLDARAAVEVCRMVRDHELLDEPEEPRLAGANLDDPQYAIEHGAAEAVVEHGVVDHALVALVAKREQIPSSTLESEQLARQLARSVVAEVSR